MPFSTAIRSGLQRQTAQLGFWLTLPCAAVAKTILQTASSDPDTGYTWCLIDAEHGLISDCHYYQLTNAIASEGASPLIRIPYAEEWMIKRALDAGAHGVMTPMCNSAEDAARIVGWSKYPPLGTRGYGPMFAAHALPGVMPRSEYDGGSNEGLMVVLQVETKSGLENVEKIAQVEGVDVLFIGPFDLAKQLGVERGGDLHEQAIQRILKAAHAAGKKAAIFCTDGEDARLRVEHGFDMVSVTTDVGVLGNGFVRELEITRNMGAVSKGRTSGY